MRILLAAIALSIANLGAAQADEIFSAPAYGGPGQTIAVCYYSFSQTVTFSGSEIRTENGPLATEVSDNCEGPFVSGRCRTVANISNSLAHWCYANVNKKGRVRGRLEVRNGAGEVLTSEQAR
jgi:hypothetical protein